MFSYEFARLLHEDRLQRAEKRRLYEQVVQLAPPRYRWVQRHLGGLLLAWGSRLKAAGDRPVPVYPPSRRLKGMR